MDDRYFEICQPNITCFEVSGIVFSEDYLVLSYFGQSDGETLSVDDVIHNIEHKNDELANAIVSNMEEIDRIRRWKTKMDRGDISEL